MKNTNLIPKILYVTATILTIVFVVLIIIGYHKHQELLSIPYIMVAPFSTMVNHLGIRLLIPAIICAVLGFILQKNHK